jgi:hypothetical protein
MRNEADVEKLLSGERLYAMDSAGYSSKEEVILCTCKDVKRAKHVAVVVVVF